LAACDTPGAIVAPEPARRAGVWETTMLWSLIVILLVLWVLGLATNLVGGLIHVLLVVALIVLVYQLITGRRVA
jgi:hypothetical protein